MSVQLAPMQHLEGALQGHARLVDAASLEFLANGPPVAKEAEWLLLAATWLVDADRPSDFGRPGMRDLLGDTAGFVERLVACKMGCSMPAQHLLRSRDLLLQAWTWAAEGCDGIAVLRALFAWAALAVALQPLAEMWRRLLPVQRALEKGVTRVAAANADQLPLIKARAWTAALFLLDGPGEAWWWLRLIRPAASLEPPWTDGEDGGVGAAPAAEPRASSGSYADEPQGGGSPRALRTESFGGSIAGSVVGTPRSSFGDQAGEGEEDEPGSLAAAAKPNANGDLGSLSELREECEDDEAA